jgi:hypothetical protein
LTIVGRVETIVGSERATVTFSNGTQVTIKEALLYPNSTHTLISFRNIRKGGLHVCTHEDNKEEFLLITKSSGYGHEVLEKKILPLRMDCTTHASNSYHMFHTRLFSRILIYSRPSIQA